MQKRKHFQYFVGIDMAKNNFWVSFNETSDPQKYSNTRIGIRSFFCALHHRNFLSSDTLLGVESTGSLHLLLCFECQKNDYTINVLNPLIVNRTNQTSLRRVKTDQKDASLIRYCLSRGEGSLFRETAQSLHFKSLLRQRDRFSVLRRQFDVQQHDIAFKEYSSQQTINSLYAEISTTLRQYIKDLEQQLSTFRSDEQALLQSIPGVGPITSVSFLSEIGDIHRFPSSSQLVAFCGLDPRVHESGSSIQGKGYITKRGNTILRTRLYNACSVAVQHSNLFQSFFQKKISEGKPYRVALVACMNKMARVIHAVWMRGTPFTEYNNPLQEKRVLSTDIY